MSKPPGGAKRPYTLTQRVERSKAKSIANGARRMPNGLLSREAAQALSDLQAAGYGSGATSCIALALIEAAARQLAKPARSPAS